MPEQENKKKKRSTNSKYELLKCGAMHALEKALQKLEKMEKVQAA